MKKKCIALASLSILIFALTACGNSKPENNEADKPESAVTEKTNDLKVYSTDFFSLSYDDTILISLKKVIRMPITIK